MKAVAKFATHLTELAIEGLATRGETGMELLPVGNTLVQLVANSDKDEDSVHQALLPYDSGNQDNVTATLAEEGRKLARESECKQEMSGGNAHSVFRLRMMTFNVCFGAFALVRYVLPAFEVLMPDSFSLDFDI